MRRLLSVVIVVGMVTGISFAQEDRPVIPKKVQAMLARQVGKWTVSEGGKTIGESVLKWGPERRYVVLEGRFSDGDDISGLLSWDGVSENGFIMQGVTTTGHWVDRMKIVSDSVAEGTMKAVRNGKHVVSKFRIELQGSDRIAFSWTDSTADGEKQPDGAVTYSRITDTSEAYELLEHLAGNWAWQGTQVDIPIKSSPYGPGGEFVGHSTSHLISDGKFLLVKFQEKSPDGTMGQGIGVVGYDAKKQCYVAHDFMGDGSIAVNTFTVDGRVRKGQIDITTHTGETFLARYVDKYSPDWNKVTATWEVSLDGGKTWSYWAKFTSKKSGGIAPPIVFNGTSDVAVTKSSGDSPPVSIEGMWELKSISLDNSPIDMAEWRSLKAFQNGTFLCTGLNRESGEVFRTHGGTYSFDGKTLTETITLVGGENMQIKVGQSFTYEIAIEDGKIHQSGQFNEQQLDEVWRRVAD